jgi:predicted lactoylglutathione lyase
MHGKEPDVLALDAITLGVPDVPAARDFYAAAFSPTITDHGQYVDVDLHGTGHIGLYGTESLASDAQAEATAPSGFRGYVLSTIVDQPSEVEALLDAAARGGAKVLQPAKKMLFAGFSAVYQAPDGAIWKLAAATRKNTGPAAQPPVPTETIAFLGVADLKASKSFYETLGMTVDRDYGTKFVDFQVRPGTCRLGLMPRKALAKDAGIDQEGSGSRAVVFNRRAGSREEVDAILSAATSAGGTDAVPAGETEWGGYSGHFTDPDGFRWKVATA